MIKYFLIFFFLLGQVFAQYNSALSFTDGYYYNNIEPLKAERKNLFSGNKYKSLSNFKPDIVGQKSVGLALIMSLVLPGSGELYMGKRGQGTLFLSSEILIWTGLLANNMYAEHLKDEYYTYATQHATVQEQGKGRQYWIDIGKYNSIYDFNEQRRRDRFFEELYEENQINFWLWDEEENRLRYDGKRIRAEEIANQDVYFYASILLNHLISGINSMRLARKHNRKLIEDVNWSIRFNSYRFEDNSNFYGLSLSKQF